MDQNAELLSEFIHKSGHVHSWGASGQNGFRPIDDQIDWNQPKDGILRVFGSSGRSQPLLRGLAQEFQRVDIEVEEQIEGTDIHLVKIKVDPDFAKKLAEANPDFDEYGI